MKVRDIIKQLIDKAESQDEEIVVHVWNARKNSQRYRGSV